MAEISVLLPMLNAQHIGWLPMEGLCCQKDAPRSWEVIIAEEQNGSEFGEARVLEYEERLRQAGCEAVKYIPLKEWIPLAAKWRLLAQHTHQDSVVCACHGADSYAHPWRIKEAWDTLINGGAHWAGYTKVPFYVVRSGQPFLVDYNVAREKLALKARGGRRRKQHKRKVGAGIAFCFRTELARKLPESDKARGIDGWLFDNIRALAEKNGGTFKRLTIDTGKWKYGLNTHGFGNISKKRWQRLQERYDECPELLDYIPRAVIQRLHESRHLSQAPEPGMNRVLVMVGTRPNLVKAAPLCSAFKEAGIDHEVWHSGQHYDDNMSGSFLREFGLKLAVSLGVKGGAYGQNVGRTMAKFEQELLKRLPRPRMVVVIGDVSTTLATAMVAARHGIRVAHVEAGCRCGKRTVEEINRIATDHLSDLLFVTSDHDRQNLVSEGVNEESVHVVGDVVADTLRAAKIVDEPPVSGKYILATIHRDYNVDSALRLSEILGGLKALAAKGYTVIFPMHPRTRGSVEGANLWELIDGLSIENPMPYGKFLAALKGAEIVITDSGGLQAESACFGVPCLTLRETTGSRHTVDAGMNTLIGECMTADRIVEAAEKILKQGGRQKLTKAMKFIYDGNASKRIASAVREAL